MEGCPLVNGTFHAFTINVWTLLSEIAVSVSVVVGNVLDHLVDELHLALRKLSVLDVLSDEVAEDAAEVFVTRI